MTLLFLILGASLAAAQPSPSVRELKATFVESIDDKAKGRALDQLARTPPVTAVDVEALYDLFMRFPLDGVRGPALQSLQRMRPGVDGVEPLILRCLEDDDAATVLFGLKGAEALRSTDALPFLRNIVKRKFKYSTIEKAPTAGERNAWSVQFEALAAMAQLDGGKALPTLEKKSREAPEVARLIGQYLWPDALPLIVRWNGGDAAEKELAVEALDAPVSPETLRPSRAAMLALVADPKQDAELRHKLAIKAGLCSTRDEVAALLKSYDEASDPFAKRLYAAAAFASRDPQIVPLLTRFAKEDPQPNVRAGARVQLKDMLPPAEYRAVLEWAAKNDPDADNRDIAQRELKVLTY